MIWHPLVWAFWAAAVTGVLLYSTGAAQAVDVMLNWAPGRADADQLQRERRAETAALLGHWALGSLTAAAMLGLVGIAVAWHRIVPGAMCGTGVLQAMGTDGSRAMIFWSLTLMILYGWGTLDRLDSRHPQGYLTQAAARTMICAAPFLVLAVFFSWQALMRIENVTPVSCCAVVYDRVLDDASGSAAMKRLAPAFLWGSLAGSAALLILAVAGIRRPGRGAGGLGCAIAVLWSVGATVSVKQVWSAYYYQVLSHPCPWCLFLPDYYGAGFFIFACVAVVVMESTALWLADRTRSRFPNLADPSETRIRRAAWRTLIALVGFTVLATGPAIAWRLHTGVWLDGAP
ncbi:hypothetical protein DSCA_28600 [Desulfosarcina alkanivorans]|uniref:Uncharacterized protein n=1 Tax=Desulfosarcina alkanivorans TaxID=571177 RepID=A0A5K7YL66_9BACT|nr:hypothetical protein [Desulfosarcina alkanivorans]BBO68930.1 hypothetical protein DSCA_28600 [Desulfosarcina alkanivorans]